MSRATLTRPPLSPERILVAATEFIDRHCVGELSMRKLGAELGVEAMSLYRYFPSKADLLDAVVARAASKLALPAARGSGTDWRDGIRSFAHSFRDLASRHPGIVSVLTGGASATGNTARHPALDPATRAVERALGAAGFSADAASRGRCAIMGYVLGSTMWQGAISDSLGSRARLDADARFNFGLDALLAGLETQRSG